ncbi:MAG: hypothetical protein LBG74_04565 [Spirochaetaceae bacterium]|jgi:hypothetical protein|nr:hypothetical protein [Spirochaetaceae bacterium]
MLGNAKKGSVWGGTKVTAAGMPLVNQAESLSKTNSRSKSRRDARFAAGLSLLALVFSLGLIGCGGDDDDDPGSGSLSALVGRWGQGGTELLKINADGSGTLSGVPGTWSVNGTTLTFSYSGQTSSATYAISSGKLTLSNPSGVLSAVSGFALDKLGDGEGGSSYKLPLLASDATAVQAGAKLTDIIAYCNAHPGTTNDSIKTGAQTYQDSWSGYTTMWGSVGRAMVTTINTWIAGLT